MLTDVQCRKAAPRDRRYKLADSRGLYLEVLPSGSKSWRWKYRFAGKENRLSFGHYPEVTLAEARDRRAEAAALLRAGKDPSVERRKSLAEAVVRSAQTFETIARDWYRSQEGGWTPRYAAIVLSSLEKDVFPTLGSLPIAEITPPLLIEVLRPIERRGAIETAHRTRQRISEVFAMAVASGMAVINPAASMGRALRAPAKGRQPAVHTREAATAVLKKVEAEPAHPLTKLASRLMALTAVRSGPVREATAGEFEGLDGDEPIWRIPAAKMKLKAADKGVAAFEFIVPLSRQAVEVVKVAIRQSGGPKMPLIFRGPRSARRPISDSTVSKLYRSAGFGGVHVPHGWRSTFSTVMNELAATENRVGDRQIIDLMLAHIPPGVEGRYNRAAYMPRRREIAQEWADMLTKGLQSAEQLLEGPRHG